MDVLIKNAEALERFEKVDTLIVDKTGTLTETGDDEVEFLRLAASLERGPEHPLAEAIARDAEERAIEMAAASEFEVTTGMGVMGVVDGRQVALGNLKLMTEMGLVASSLIEKADARRDEGETVMFVVLDGAIVGSC